MSKLPIGILISGRGSNMVAILENIKAGKLEAEPKIVISNKAEAAGLQKASEYGIPTVALNIKDFESKEAYEEKVAELLKEAGVELIVLAGYMRVLGEGFIAKFENQIINIHPSLLPDFKGLHAQRQALEAGVKKAGCSVHYVNNELDAGEVILQAEVDVYPDDTEETLSQRILVEEHKLYTQAIQWVINKKENNE